jgi:hypothetical protein
MQELIDNNDCFLSKGIWFNGCTYDSSIVLEDISDVGGCQYLADLPKAWFYGTDGNVVTNIRDPDSKDGSDKNALMSFAGHPSPASWLDAYEKACMTYVTIDSTTKLQDFLRAFNNNLSGAIQGQELTHGVKLTLADLQALQTKIKEIPEGDERDGLEDELKIIDVIVPNYEFLVNRIDVVLKATEKLEAKDKSFTGEEVDELKDLIKQSMNLLGKDKDGLREMQWQSNNTARANSIPIMFYILQARVDELRDHLIEHRSNVQIFDIETLANMLIVIAATEGKENPDRFYYSDAGTFNIQSLNFYSAEDGIGDPVESWRLGNRLVMFTNSTIEHRDVVNDYENPIQRASGSSVFTYNVLQNSRVKFNDTLYFIAKPIELDAYSIYSLSKDGQLKQLSHPQLDAFINNQIRTDFGNYNPITTNSNVDVKGSIINYENAPIIQWRLKKGVSILNYNLMFNTFFLSDNMYFLVNNLYFQAGTQKIGKLDNYFNDDGTRIHAKIMSVNSNFQELPKSHRYKTVNVFHADVEIENKKNTQMSLCCNCLGNGTSYNLKQSKDTWNSPNWLYSLNPDDYQAIYHRFARVSKMPYTTAREIRIQPKQGDRNVQYRVNGLGLGIDFQTEIAWNGYLKINRFWYELE